MELQRQLQFLWQCRRHTDLLEVLARIGRPQLTSSAPPVGQRRTAAIERWGQYSRLCRAAGDDFKLRASDSGSRWLLARDHTTRHKLKNMALRWAKSLPVGEHLQSLGCAIRTLGVQAPQ